MLSRRRLGTAETRVREFGVVSERIDLKSHAECGAGALRCERGKEWMRSGKNYDAVQPEYQRDI